jgi:UDP-GlcNAc:undecaprenyl-phosphate GlcNAc-1-phosphate transferase
MWSLIYIYVFAVSLILSAILTAVARAVSHKLKIYDYPGERKLQDKPMPVLGGAAMLATFILITGANLLVLRAFKGAPLVPEWAQEQILAFLGSAVYGKLIGLFIGALVIFLVGLVDDLRHLSPGVKLFGQIVAGLILVLSGIRLELFIPNVVLGSILTIFWIVLMTNSVNFLDNMDGLAAGVTAIAAIAFFLAVAPLGQTFTSVMFLVVAGTMVGFLFYNFNPATIFMGDAGSMLCGYMLASLAVLGTFYTASSPTRVAVLIPVLALGVPLFDTVGVIYIRVKNGESIIRGDKRHFSHRLVDSGMTQKEAVVFIYLVAAVVGLGATLLSSLGTTGVITVIAQAVGVFAIVSLLMANSKRQRVSD